MQFEILQFIKLRVNFLFKFAKQKVIYILRAKMLTENNSFIAYMNLKKWIN